MGRSIHQELGIINTDEDDITKKTRRTVKKGHLNVLEMIEKNKNESKKPKVGLRISSESIIKHE